MLSALFPKIANNNYKGHKLAKWLLFLIVFKSFFAGSIHMFAPDGGAQSIASIALNEFTQGGSDTVITIFAFWGMEQFVIGLIGLLVLFRYQSLIPMMWGIYSIEYFMRKVLELFTPGVYSQHTPPGVTADYILIPLCICMFILALYSTMKSMKKNKI